MKLVTKYDHAVYYAKTDLSMYSKAIRDTGNDN